MKKEELIEGKKYAHIRTVYTTTKDHTLKEYVQDTWEFLSIKELGGKWAARFKEKNGKTIIIAGWAVERNICELYKAHEVKQERYRKDFEIATFAIKQMMEKLQEDIDAVVHKIIYGLY
jgi:hypothetical protein